MADETKQKGVNMINQQTQSSKPKRPRRAAFTLVEMLVSVTLVLMMMTLFTSIFSMATDSVSRQKGIAELDQGARICSNVIQADMAKRTMRYCLPYYPGELAATSVTSFGKRAGYIYFSANDPNSGIDDVLQFTVNSELTFEEADSTLSFGAAAMLYDRVAESAGELRRTALRFNPNQPEADDSELAPNGVTASTGAEISYFMRNGALYRRKILLREPLPVIGGDQAVGPRSLVQDNPYFLSEADGLTADGGGRFWYVATPSAINPAVAASYQLTGTALPPATWNVTQTNDFWQQFDLAAKPIGNGGGGTNPSAGVELMGVTHLANDGDGFAPALGNPVYRWGFDFYTGESREHMDTAGTNFLGRFLSAETSDWRFNWPISGCRNEPTPISGSPLVFTGTLIGSGNPMDRVNTTLTPNVYGVAAEFDGDAADAGNATDVGRGGRRKVEDLLLPNVHEFRVEIWDDRAQQFVVPGYGTISGSSAEVVGDYHIRRCLQADVSGNRFPIGPLAPYTPSNTSTKQQPHVLDTWHPDLANNSKFDFDGDPAVDQLYEISPPYLPYRLTPPLQPTGPTPALITDPVDTETANIRSFTSNNVSDIPVTNRGYMQFSDVATTVTYAVNDAVFVPWSLAESDPVVNGGNGNGTFDYNEISEPNFHIAYRCVFAGNPGTQPSALDTINWPKTPGLRITFGGTQWEAFDNRQPLKSMRVKIRFQDPSTELLRQVTLNLPITVDE